MSEINDALVEQLAIQMHSIHSDDNDPKWAKQPGKYRAQMRRDARDAFTALEKLGFAVVKGRALAAKDAEIAQLRDLIRWAHDTLWEINPSNYDHDEVCKLNDASVEVILGLSPTLGERHGKTAEWWEARAALKEKAHA